MTRSGQLGCPRSCLQQAKSGRPCEHDSATAANHRQNSASPRHGQHTPCPYGHSSHYERTWEVAVSLVAAIRAGEQRGQQPGPRENSYSVTGPCSTFRVELEDDAHQDIIDTTILPWRHNEVDTAFRRTIASLPGERPSSLPTDPRKCSATSGRDVLLQDPGIQPLTGDTARATRLTDDSYSSHGHDLNHVDSSHQSFRVWPLQPGAAFL